MAEGKWISGLKKGMPVLKAARLALQVRLGAVKTRFAAAVGQPDKDVEQVHQLRVSTRRAGAALRIFARFLPDKIQKRARKHLRRLRRAAGETRDWDVFFQTLSELRTQASSRQKPGLDLITGFAQAQRIGAQASLLETANDPKLDLDRLAKGVAESLREPQESEPARTLRDLAGPMLDQLLTDFHVAPAKNLQDYEQLHRVRIAGKNLRYAMEIFASCYPSPLCKESYPAVEAMQDILGLANDSHVASVRLEVMWDRFQPMEAVDRKRYQPGIDSLLKYHDERLPRQRDLFLEWRAEWERSGTEARLLRMIGAEV